MIGTLNFGYFVFVQCDKKPRQVDEVDGKLWADSHGFHYFETSAATGDGVIEMFNVRKKSHVAQCIKSLNNTILSLR